MQKRLQLWRLPVTTQLVPFPAAAVHLQAVQCTIEIHQLCLLGSGHAKALNLPFPFRLWVTVGLFTE